MLAGKRVLILGYGREGRSSLKRILEAGGFAELAIADQASLAGLEEVRRLAEEAGLPEPGYITGPGYQEAIRRFDLVMKSPGIVLEQEPGAYGEKVRITSQAELFLEWFRNQTIGITGTKGKSTTTTLLHHILKENGISAILLGNIGIPAFDRLDDMNPETVAVFEFSCHQLEYNSQSPHIAVYLNLFEEHLDHYGSFAKYREAKENIYRHQRAGDVLYCGKDVCPQVDRAGIGAEAARVVAVYPYGEKPGTAAGAIWLEGAVICDGTAPVQAVPAGNTAAEPVERFAIPAEGISLHGHHNWFDIAIAYGVARRLGVGAEGFRRALSSYQPLPHRLEYVGTVGGVRYYDDSISTVCETTIQALETFPETGSVLIGGMDRGIDYTDLIHYLAKSPTPHIILMEATGERIFEEIKKLEPGLAASGRIVCTGNLEEAVRLAKQLTAPGTCCILSPAAASYGIFRNFEERGEAFQQMVRGGVGEQQA